jgi:selenocysteine lyase/cysteine desulfurase
LQAIEGVTIHGITEEARMADRVPTVTFTRLGYHPTEIAQALGCENIFVWDGHYYAIELVKRLGLDESGGMVRLGAVHYNTIEEIDRLLEAIANL